jgi:three-Cys-motif partner protein
LFVSVEYDEIGIWSEVKLAIVREYAAAYSKIMEGTRRDRINRLSWIYIDAYAGPGYHLSKTTGETVEGSPLIALNTDPPFHEYHFIDTEPAREQQLRTIAGNRQTSIRTQRTATPFSCATCSRARNTATTGARSASSTRITST